MFDYIFPFPSHLVRTVFIFSVFTDCSHCCCLQIRNLKDRGMDFLVIPDTYYENLRARLKDAPIKVEEDLDVVSWCTLVLLALCLQLFRERLSEKKNIQVYATRPKGGLDIHWNFAYWPKGNLQVCFFARGKFVFPLWGLYL